MRDLRFVSASTDDCDACEVCGTVNSVAARACAACGTPLISASTPIDGAAGAWKPTTDSPRALPPGTLLQSGAYRVEGVIGQGGFGITYRATDTNLGREVAVKEFFPGSCDRAGRDVIAAGGLSAIEFEDARGAFLEEARALAHFRHHGIVHVYAAWEENSSAYMAMELLRGQTLAEIFASRPAPLPEDETLALALDITQALQVVHDRGWLHRDIKPENIVLTDPETMGERRVVLLDFGAAKQVSGTRTQQFSVVVTPGYAPLEQYATRARRGAYTDIYALCATLYHALSGEAPPAASDRAVGIELRPLRELNRSVSETTARAIEAGLQTEINRRPQSVREFLDLLEGKTAPQTPLAPPKDWRSQTVGTSPATQSTLASSFAAASAPTFAPLSDYDQLRSREVQQAMLSRIAQGNSDLTPQTLQRTTPHHGLARQGGSTQHGGIANRPVPFLARANWLHAWTSLLHQYAFLLALGFGLVFFLLLGLSWLTGSPPPPPMSYSVPPSMSYESAPVQPVAPPALIQSKKVAPKLKWQSVFFSPDAKWMLVRLNAGNLELRRPGSKQITTKFRGWKGALTDVRWLSDSGHFITTSSNPYDPKSSESKPNKSIFSQIGLWRVTDGKRLWARYGEGGAGMGYALSNDERRMYIPWGNALFEPPPVGDLDIAQSGIWETATGRTLKTFGRNNWPAPAGYDMFHPHPKPESVSSDFSRLLTSALTPHDFRQQNGRSSFDNQRLQFFLVDVNTGRSRPFLEQWDATIIGLRLQLIDDNHALLLRLQDDKVAGFRGHEAIVIDVNSAETLARWTPSNGMRAYAFGDFVTSPDKATLATLTSANEILIWNWPRNHHLRVVIPEIFSQQSLPQMTFSPNGRWLMIHHIQKGVRLIDLKSGDLWQLPTRPGGEYTQAAWSSDSDHIVWADLVSGKSGQWKREHFRRTNTSPVLTNRPLQQHETHALPRGSFGGF